MRGLPNVPALPVFSPRVTELLSRLSKALFSDKRAREYRDVAGFAYWIRGSSLARYREAFPRADEKMGRGVAFHIAPSNIPVQFALSLVYTLLAGDPSVVRVSSRDFPQVELICGKLNELLRGEFRDLAGYVSVIRYPRDGDVTAWLSSFCDARVIWGGDETVREVRRFAIPPRAVELTFADRYSFAVINADALSPGGVPGLVNAFWNDTYFVDQNACSSPRLVAWLGSGIEPVREMFWEALREKARREYGLTAFTAVDKLSAFAGLSMSGGEPGARLLPGDNFVTRVSVEHPTSRLMAYKDGGGYFFEYGCEKLEELVPLMSDKACQTVAVYGVEPEEVRRLVFSRGLRGVDRVVPVGRAGEPGIVWDGVNVVEALSRAIPRNDPASDASDFSLDEAKSAGNTSPIAEHFRGS